MAIAHMQSLKTIYGSLKNFLNSAFLGTISIDTISSTSKDNRQVYTQLAETVATEVAPLMPFSQEAKAVQKSVYTTPDIFSIILKNIYYSPEYNFLHTKNRQIIEESISTQRNLAQFRISHFYCRKVQKISAVCSTFRSHKNGYYHTLIDNLPRLYLLNSPGFRQLPSIKVLCGHKLTAVESFYLQKLLPPNAHIEIVKKERAYCVENFIFLSFLTKRFAGYLPQQYVDWFLLKTAPNRERKKRHRIFISRVPTHKGAQRCLLNEDELFESLQKRGFKKYVLDTMKIEEQIELFYDAESVVGTHGAGLSNLIFSKNVQVLELFPAPFVVPHYYYLSKSMNHQYNYWCGKRKYRNDNFTVDIPQILEILDDFSKKRALKTHD
ncbi:MAG: glycosyltransferase family 61 protein [Cyanobacteria bacterium J06560_5]